MDYRQRLARATAFIEKHLADSITQKDIASSACMSSFHFARVFREVTGQSTMHYVRGRRLAVAVHAMRDSDLPIIEIALDVGFDSHQGFIRAFRRTFGLTPGAYRRAGFPLPLQEMIDMAETRAVNAPKIPKGPEFRDGEAMLVAGPGIQCTQDSKEGIPVLWSEFAPTIANVPNLTGFATYGVCSDHDGTDGSFTYHAAVQVSKTPDNGLDTVEIPAARYAVFTHEGSLDHIADTVGHIFGTWLPTSEFEHAGTPDFERYDERFNPDTGVGSFEYWVPIKPRG